MSIYFDISALAKLVLIGKESAALRGWIGSWPNSSPVTNSVGVVELQRLGARVSQSAVSAAVQFVGPDRSAESDADLPSPSGH